MATIEQHQYISNRDMQVFYEDSRAALDQQDISNRDMQVFYEDSRAALDQLIVGEERAKDAVIVGPLIERPILLSGLPGGGKSTFIHNLYRMYGFMDQDDVARIPGQHDLVASQIIGGEIGSERQIDGKTESSITVVKGLVTPLTRGITVEEMNRTAPEVVNSLLPVLESRRIENTAGHLAIKGLVYMVAVQNPAESKQSTLPISDAAASRLMGSIVGLRPEGRKKRFAKVKAIRKFEANPDAIKPVVRTENKFNAIKEFVKQTPMSQEVEDKIDNIALDTADFLREEHNIHESDNRFPLHIEAAAKALGSLRSESHLIRDEDIFDATWMVIAGRLGAKKSTNGLTESNLRAMVKDVTKL